MRSQPGPVATCPPNPTTHHKKLGSPALRLLPKSLGNEGDERTCGILVWHIGVYTRTWEQNLKVCWTNYFFFWREEPAVRRVPFRRRSATKPSAPNSTVQPVSFWHFEIRSKRRGTRVRRRSLSHSVAGSVSCVLYCVCGRVSGGTQVPSTSISQSRIRHLAAHHVCRPSWRGAPSTTPCFLPKANRGGQHRGGRWR